MLHIIPIIILAGCFMSSSSLLRSIFSLISGKSYYTSSIVGSFIIAMAPTAPIIDIVTQQTKL